MSYSNSFPTQRPTLNLDFANSGKLDSRISYSRSSSGTALSSERHLSSENLLLQSQDFDTSWSRDASLNAPTGSQTAPDGTSTAWLLTTAASGTGMPFLFQNTAPPSNNTVCTYVMHIKAGTASHAYISFRGQSSAAAAWALIDFASPTSPTTGGSLSSISATSVSLGNSWYRVALTFDTGTISSGYPYLYVGASDGTSPDSTGRVTWTYSGETIYAWGAQLSSTNSKVYDSPTTTQIHREYAPTLKTFAADEPRFEYTADGESEGLLIEAQSTNLIPSSDDFSTGWSIDNIAVSASTAIAPDGTLSASLLRATGSTFHRIRRILNVTSGNNYSASIYVKAAGYSHLFLGSGNTNTWAARAYFDLSNGTVGTVPNGTATIEDVGNGYYRCVINGTAGASSGVYLEINVCEQDNATSFTSNDFGGLLAFGLQFEEGSASSLISTSGASATRSADSCSVDLSDVGVTSGQDVTLFVEGDYGDPAIKSSNRVAANLQEGSNANWVFIYNGSGNAGTGYVANGGADQALFVSGITSGAFKSAISAKNNVINYAANGTAGTTDTAGSVPLFTVLRIGGYSSSGLELDGNLKRVSLYGQALSSTELAALTS